MTEDVEALVPRDETEEDNPTPPPTTTSSDAEAATAASPSSNTTEATAGAPPSPSEDDLIPWRGRNRGRDGLLPGLRRRPPGIRIRMPKRLRRRIRIRQRRHRRRGDGAVLASGPNLAPARDTTATTQTNTRLPNAKGATAAKATTTRGGGGRVPSRDTKVGLNRGGCLVPSLGRGPSPSFVGAGRIIFFILRRLRLLLAVPPAARETRTRSTWRSTTEIFATNTPTNRAARRPLPRTRTRPRSTQSARLLRRR
mmetsp:Transcript_8639/g.18450  ORF Transcript_8639/g.18450 Transcript_8639/m.18450 type:complete len:254 (-) Transcript_8639:1897-2658(-)